MIGMTGFGTEEGVIKGVGRISVELRSTNHKYLEIVSHLPEGLLILEDKIKKTLEQKIKRGRINCVVNVSAYQGHEIYIDEKLLACYIKKLKLIMQRYHLSGQLGIETLITLPGVLSVSEKKIMAKEIWPVLRSILLKALESLMNMRKKEGKALSVFLEREVKQLIDIVHFVKHRFEVVSKQRLDSIPTELERAAFLKEIDISEELDRLSFHARSFHQKLTDKGAIGKELDFICQEMHREANTIGAKSCDVEISSAVVRMKSQIEKLREQVQNVE
ncbi:MAG: YicC family protein [Candidatus Omnitrophica bacterium]|nr:YicC family protein [Candidatus Omnitrophota bacterium]